MRVFVTGIEGNELLRDGSPKHRSSLVNTCIGVDGGEQPRFRQVRRFYTCTSAPSPYLNVYHVSRHFGWRVIGGDTAVECELVGKLRGHAVCR